MRNMSFALTTDQMRRRKKFVTRRLGWWFLKPGDQVMAVEKSQGLKKGERVKRITPIRIVSTREEPLEFITRQDVDLEGFPEMSIIDFITHFCASHHGCTSRTVVNRIEFEFI